MTDPMHFDGIAGGYGAARPPYPAALWWTVEETGLVTPGRVALDLGAGSGEATGELLARGMDVIAVEPGEHLAAILAQRLPRATTIRARAEDLDLAPASVDLAVAATSIHWMDLGLVLPIVHRTLAPAGRLLIWRNVFGDADAEITPFRREVQRIVDRRSTVRAGDPESADLAAERVAASGLFTIAGIHRYRWSIDLTTDQVRALFTTFSDWSLAEVEAASAAVAALGGTVTEYYTSWLIDARPIPL
ncbi:class I SAM-dependent methyltransferase [Microbacterium sp. KUDC0406]|uniref:class I SAM-dependent methyltransferase n=1 Tax=Microbacterium sp. KUDC0406 TaxID=2909588 RepID=UPI001F219B0F|nr:class I SAM-dependent methyltransferase [Microbacterium sp. KUDC0406]UJP09406.1 class I SAM-dependent methyltransferase [Microbacterium sp. KUDC0406]